MNGLLVWSKCMFVDYILSIHIEIQRLHRRNRFHVVDLSPCLCHYWVLDIIEDWANVLVSYSLIGLSVVLEAKHCNWLIESYAYIVKAVNQVRRSKIHNILKKLASFWSRQFFLPRKNEHFYIQLCVMSFQSSSIALIVYKILSLSII